MPLKALSDILWRERELLEHLLFKLEVEQLLITSGRTTRLPIATQEVEDVLAAIREAELGRTVEVAAAATSLGLPDDVSLLDLAKAAPVPWDGILLEHRKQFARLTAEIADLAKSNQELLAGSHRATQETLMSIQNSIQTYGPTGSTVTSSPDARLIDETF